MLPRATSCFVDASTLASRCLDDGERHVDWRGEHDGVRCAEFSADGEWVATGSRDGTLHVWPVHPLPLARAHYARLTGR